jgi:hypothetical protein
VTVEVAWQQAEGTRKLKRMEEKIRVGGRKSNLEGG